MTDNEMVIKHLEFIQGIINRLAQNSFYIKSWSMGLLTGAILLISKQDNSSYILTCFFIPILGFWILDGYFLWQERFFRCIYDDVRKQETTNFKMNTLSELTRKNNKWISAILSLTLSIFYLIEIIFLALVILII